MTLAPIRGAPRGTAIPEFPAEGPNAKPRPTAATPASRDQGRSLPARPSYAPVEIAGNGITLTFKVIPEQPAISRASLVVQVGEDPMGQSSHALGFLRMSAIAARMFLFGLRDGRFPIVATGDEDGTVQIECGITDCGLVFLVRKPGGEQALHRCIIEWRFDLKTIATELLADLGA